MWLVEDDKYAKMEASVSGRVLHTDGSEMTIECKNGRLVKVIIDPINEFELTEIGRSRSGSKKVTNKKELNEKTIIGNKVEVEGWCYFRDGEISVFADAILVSYRNGYCALYKIDGG